MAIAGVGAAFRRWSGSAWVPIAQINSISGPGMTRETIDTTSLDTTGGYRTFITGFRDGGTMELTMNFTRAAYDLMKTDFEATATVNYELTLPDADNTTFEFEGLVTDLPLEVPTDDKVAMTVTIKISGQVTVNSGSGSGA